MSTSTRIFLTLTAVMLAVLVVYYGILSDGTPAVSRASESIDATTQDDAATQRPVRETPPPVRISAPAEPEVLPAPPELDDEPQEEDPLETAAPLEEHEPVTISESTEEDAGGKDGPPAGDVDEDIDDDAEDVAEEEQPEPEPEPVVERPVYINYTVKERDTMSSIAAEWFGDASKWDLIAKANPLVDPARLRVGQVLRLPPKNSERDPIDSNAVEYIVRSGDTLTKISRAYYGTERHWRLIYEANMPTIGLDPNNLKVGMRLSIPPAPKPAD